MTEIKETWQELKEKTINFWFRLVLRVMAWGTLVVGMIFRLWLPWITSEKVEGLTNQEVWVFVSTIALILSIEGVKAAVDAYIKRKSEK